MSSKYGKVIPTPRTEAMFKMHKVNKAARQNLRVALCQLHVYTHDRAASAIEGILTNHKAPLIVVISILPVVIDTKSL